MHIACRSWTCLALSLALAGQPDAAPQSTLDEEEARIVHALNRLAHGPRPGDVEAVRTMGLAAWIDRQLRPEDIRDDALASRLDGIETVALSSAELMEGYAPSREARREIQKRRAELGGNPSQEDERKARRELMRKYRGDMKGLPRQVVEELQAAKVLRAVYSERQLDEVLVDFWLNHFNVFADKGAGRFLIGAYERDVIRPHAWGRFEDLLKATAESPAMLFYLDNWLSVDPEAASRLGERRNTGKRSRIGGRGLSGRRRPARERMAESDAPPPQGRGRRRGLNENYAREIMELHTLGVDGGYTQKDVTEVARCFTGWTVRGLRDSKPEFTFDGRVHDRGDKVVLGRRIEAGGKDEADRVIHMLASHPSTARFVSYKLARRFVADEPPPALVDRAAATFRSTDGDIRAVVDAIVRSAEFAAPEARAAKVKTPFELVVSAVRASGAEVTDARDLARRVAGMGMPLYLQQAPTGYKETAEAWVSTSGLLARLNFALDLAAGKVSGVRMDLDALAGAGRDPASALAARLVPAGLSESTKETLAGEDGLDSARVAGLILGSPEFQRR